MLLATVNQTVEPAILETRMNITIQAQGFELTEALRQHTMRRFDSARWTRDVQQIQVRLSDVNGPKGGADKRCQVQISLANESDVIIENIEDDLYLAIDRACARTKRTVTKRLERRRPERISFTRAWS